jgi:hypothetical protein
MKQFDTLCLSGGGIKGFAFIGVIKYLEEINYIDVSKINKYVGTSIGSIMAFFLSLGYSCKDIETFILEFDLNKLQGDVNIDNLIFNHGIDSGENIALLLQEFIDYKYNVKDLTFEEHYKLTKTKLSIIGTNYTKGVEAMFNYETKPNMSVITAIRISCAIPVMFIPVLFENEYYIDGGCINNFPLKYCNIATTLGIYIKWSCCNNMNNFINLLMGTISIMCDAISIKDSKLFNIIEIEHYTQEFTRFDLTYDEKKKMINIGITYAKKYIDNQKIINIDSEEELMQNKFN